MRFGRRVSQCGIGRRGVTVYFDRRGVTVCVLIGRASQCAFW